MRFSVRIVTPAFSYGAASSSAPKPEIRPPSIKGLIRWWFRTSANGTLLHLGATPEESLKCVRKMEDLLFGSTERGSPFRLRVLPEGLRTGVKAKDLFSECCYLLKDEGEEVTRYEYRVGYLGYGIDENLESIEGNFVLSLDFKRGIRRRDQELSREIVTLSVALWGALGGIGRRQRRGFGSVAVSKVLNHGEMVPKEIELTSDPFRLETVMSVLKELEERIGEYSKDVGCEISGRSSAAEPGFTALHSSTLTILQGPSLDDPVDALRELAFRLRRFREVGSQAKEECVKPKKKEVTEKQPVTVQYEEQIRPLFDGRLRGEELKLEWSVFGLPHNYFSPSRWRKAKEGGSDLKKRGRRSRRINYRAIITWSARGSRGSRRASPVFAKVVPTDGGKYAPIVYTMPSPYLPSNSELRVQLIGSGRTFRSPVPSMNKLTEFFNYLREAWSQDS